MTLPKTTWDFANFVTVGQRDRQFERINRRSATFSAFNGQSQYPKKVIQRHTLTQSSTAKARVSIQFVFWRFGTDLANLSSVDFQSD